MDDPNVLAVAVQMLEDEEAEEEALLMAMARLAAAELMELEEGPGFDDLLGPAWAPITVNIDEYHFNACFKLHFRMSRPLFEALTIAVRNHLIEKRRLIRERTPFEDIMLMVIWLLATPDSFRSVALRFGVTPGTLHYFYSYVIEALREMAEQYIVWPDREERRQIKEAFEEATGFPGTIGCIDGTHVNLTAPLDHPANYVNRHDVHSINVQAVVDNNLLVRQLHVGEVGSMNDKRVFRRSPLQRALLQRGEDRIIEMDEHVLGDGGYTLTDFMMIPFPNNGHLTPEQKNYNKRLSQGRVRVENSFALAKGKWRRLKFLHARNQAVVVDHITACFVIHNFLILNGEPIIDEDELRRPIRDVEVLGNNNVEEPDDPDDPGVPGDGAEDPEAANLREQLIAAGMRGEEKRIAIMYNLPQL